MNHTVQTLELSGSDTLRYQSWHPEKSLRGVMLVVHGFAEHGGRYEEFAAQLNRRGFAVATIDLPGHGKSTGARCCVTHFDQFLRAVEVGHEAAEREFRAQDNVSEGEARRVSGNVPFFLLGHSMGGLIASLYAQRHGSRFAGALFSGSAMLSEPAPPKLQVAMVKLVARLFPAAGLLKLDARGVSRDPAVVEKYLNDPLVYTGKIPACLLVAMFAAMDQSVSGLGDISLPVLIMHGEADTIVSPKASHLLMDKIGSNDKELRLFPGLFHEIFNEPEREEVIDEAIQWAEARLTQAK